MTVNNVAVWTSSAGAYVRVGVTKTPAPPTPPTISKRFPADPNSTLRKRIYFGATVSGNSYPAVTTGTNQHPAGNANTIAEHETAAGTSMGINRQFLQTLSNYGSSSPVVTGASSDHTAHRVPWISFKFAQNDWANVSSGSFDTQLDQLIAALNALTHDTIITVNHEPENDWKDQSALSESAWTIQFSQAWRGMQSRIRSRINAWKTANPTKTNRIAFVPVLMSFTWLTSSGRNPDDWFCGSSVHDFIGVDHYADVNQSVDRTEWVAFLAYAKAKGMAFGVAEFGVRSYDANSSTKLNSFYGELTDGSKDCVGICFFDSNQNTGLAGWILTDQHGTHTVFHNLMKDARSVHASDTGA